MPIDGGRLALSGYLYQTIGALGIAANLSNLAPNPENIDGDLEFLINLLNVENSEDLRIETERFGEDAIVQRRGFSSNDTSVLIQFKFSNNPNENPIRRGDLFEIIDAFDRNVRVANEAGANVSACVLISNRRFTKRGRNTSAAHWGEIYLEKDYRLEKFLEVPNNHFEEQLLNFACSYGVFENEYERGVNDLIGQVLQEVLQETVNYNSGIIKDKILQAFTGSREAQPLDLPSLSPRCANDLVRFEELLIITENTRTPIRREIVNSLLEHTRTRALIGLFGLGGCGKSVILWWLVKALEETTSYAIFPTNEISHELIPNKVNHSWRNIHQGQLPRDQIGQAIDRIRIANPDSNPPVFILGLDGLDEDTNPDGHRQFLNEILDWFWRKDRECQENGEEPDALLIVTCRKENKLINVLDIPEDAPGPRPLMIPVYPFNQTEIYSAFEQYFPGYLSKEMRPRYFFQDGDLEISQSLEHGDTEITIGDQQLLTDLYHPVIWRALLNLPENVQRRLFQGDIDARNQLASNFITWFVHKLRRRDPHWILENDELVDLLADIARETVFQDLNQNNTWREITNPSLGPRADNFFKEADLAGIIEFISNAQWRWKHKFVYDYLFNHQG